METFLNLIYYNSNLLRDNIDNKYNILNIETQLIHRSKFGIDCICKLIDKTNIKSMFNMLADPKHPITAKLPKNIRATSLSRTYNTFLIF